MSDLGWGLLWIAGLVTYLSVAAWMNQMLRETKRTNELLTRIAGQLYDRERP